MSGLVPVKASPSIPPRAKQRIIDVAKDRVEGMSWAKVATKYGYKNEDSAHKTVTQDYPTVWREEYERAREHMLDGVEAHAIETQKELTKETYKPYIRQLAAHSLLLHTSKLRGQKIEVSNPDGSLKQEPREVIRNAVIQIMDTLKAHPEAKRELAVKLNGNGRALPE